MKKIDQGFVIKGSDINLYITFYDENIVRCTYTNEDIISKSTPAIIRQYRKDIGAIEGDVIKTKKLHIKVNPDNLCISIFNSSGELINEDIAVKYSEIKIEKKLLWEKGFYGNGERYGWINQKGLKLSNWNTDLIGKYDLHNSTIKEMHTAIPFYIGVSPNRSYGIYFDNSYRTSFDLGKTDDSIISFQADGGKLDYYFIYGEEIGDVVKGYTYLTGKMEIPRKDFLGYQQSRYSYMNSDEVLEIAKEFRDKKIPCDVLYLDIHYMEDYKVFTVDSKRFSEFREMIKELNQMGFKVVVIIDPGVKVEEDYFVYEEGKERNYFIKDSLGKDYIGEVWPGPAVFPDFLKGEVRDWWGELHRNFIENGIEGIWNDMNEPSNFITESKTLPEDTLHIDDEGNERSHGEIHNIYGMLEAKATYYGFRKLKPNTRPFILTRAAFSGTQKYAALWTGDNSSIWEHLECSIPMFLNLGLSGFSFVGADVGGFLEDTNGELLCRWTQLGAFTTFFRNHTMVDTIYQEPWRFGKEVLENTKKYIELRYRLIPYLYSLMKDSANTGEPVMRPLFYHYQDDLETYNINDQFLFGEKVLVCPVTRPGITKRMVYLPEGIWYDFWSDEKIEGGKYIIKEAPLDSMPIFIKAGAIIPMDKVMDYVGQRESEITLHCYAGDRGNFNLYFDDGHSYDYKKGKYTEMEIRMTEDDKNIRIHGSIKNKGYDIPNIQVKVHGLESKKEVHVSGFEG